MTKHGKGRCKFCGTSSNMAGESPETMPYKVATTLKHNPLEVRGSEHEFHIRFT